MKQLEEQYDKLVELLNYLKSNNEYWSKILTNYNEITSKNIKEIYNNLKITTKQLILNNMWTYIDNQFTKNFKTESELKEYLLETKDLSKNYNKYLCINKKNWTVETTTGTTGKPFPVIKSKKEIWLAAKELLKARRQYYSDANIQNGFLLAHEVDSEIQKMDYRKEDSNMHDVIDYFLAKQPKWMFVSVNSLKRLTTAMKSYKTDEIKKIDIKFIEVTGAKLYDVDKQNAIELFNCPIVNQYGCREAWYIGYQCKCGNLHINTKNLMVDLIDENGHIINEENKLGEVVVTNLTSKTTPFIKYYLGDYASISYTKCKCGNDSPIITLGNCRKSECLKNTKYSGSDVFRRILRVLYFRKNIRYNKIKIIQDQEYHLSVYIDCCNNKNLFEENFIKVSSMIIDVFNCFKITFIYEYPFLDEDTFLKEQIFICKVE